MSYTPKQVFDALHHVTHPEQNKDIIQLGMVHNLSIEGKKISFDLIAERANDPVVSSIRKACVSAISTYVDNDAEIKGNINIVVKQEAPKSNKVLPGVKNIIAIASGKGGVGKSTVAANLAVSLSKAGYKIGLLDADIYGPSIPKMFNVEDTRPQVKNIGGIEKIIPVEAYGVNIISIGFFINKEDAAVWRGPMATNAIKQFIHQGEWGSLDFLLIDLPPGTSDIHLTMVQELSVTGAVIITTPQQVATIDATKGINMFRGEKINVPVLGIIENMSWFTPAELPENKYFIFGKDGGEKLSQKFNIPLLGQIPIVQSICENMDDGKPSAVETESITAKAFADLANKLVAETNKRNELFSKTKKVEITNNDGCSAVNN